MRKASGAESPGASAVPPPARARFGRWSGGVAALLTLVLLATFAAWRRCPYLPDGFTGQVIFPKGIEGRVEPLVCAGRYGAADFLVLNYAGPDTATLTYDCWGVGGPISAPFTFKPGVPYPLRVEMPGLTGRVPVGRELRPLRVLIDGREILSGNVRFHPRAPHHIYFAENPVGGNTAWSIFHGQILTADGQRLLGGHRELFRWPARLAWWLRTAWWEAVAVVLASVAVGAFGRRVVAWCVRHRPSAFPPRVFTPAKRPPHAWFAATALLCTALFATLVTAGTFQFVFEEAFGDFYDHQARSLLQGRLDVPEEAIGGEAFVVDGKFYGYFGVTPAVLRLPFVAAGVAFGKLSRAFFVGYYVACLLGGYLLLCHATRRLVNGGWPSALATVLFTVAIGLGSSLFFLGGRAYIYHEAILCGAAFALWTLYWSFRYMTAPASRAGIGALLCGILAIQARPSSGLFALCVLGVAAGWNAWRNWNSEARLSRADPLRGRSSPFGIPAVRRALAIGALAAVGILSFNGMSFLKFRTFDGSPFRYSVQYSEERRAKFEGRNFHLSNLPHNLDTFVLHPGFHLRPAFPYFFIYEDDRAAAPGARIDLEEPSLGFPYAMPALFVLTFLGGAWAAWWAPPLRPALGVLLIALGPMALALFSAVVTSHRYTADFCPFFIAAGACGLAVWDAESRPWRRGFLALTAVLTVISVFVTSAITLRFQGEVVWGVPDEGKQNYERLRTTVDRFFGTGRQR